MLRNLVTDKLYILAVLAALVFWAVYPGLAGIGNHSFNNISWYTFFMVVFAYPIVEEGAFRGFLQTNLLQRKIGQKRFMGITLANVLTSIAFSALHLVYNPAFWAVAVFFPSMVFGFFRDRHDSIIPGMILHIWYNSGFYFLFLFYYLR